MEEWKIIENTNNCYKISNQGRIASKKRFGEWLILKPPLQKNGYKATHIHFVGDKKRKLVNIHRLVAQYFELFFNSRHISDVLKGKRNQVKGYTFEYIGGGD